MTIEGRLRPGDVLRDFTAPRGYVREVVAIQAGKLPTPIDPSLPRWSSSTESCALFGAPVRHDAG